MNEIDWLGGVDPQAMLNYLGEQASPRKLRLFACACVRLRWELLRYPTPRQAVELAERFAEGQATPAEVEQLRPLADQSAWNGPEFERLTYLAAAATLQEDARQAAQIACMNILQQYVFDEVSSAMSRADEARILVEVTATSGRRLGVLAQEIFGNPFRPVTIEPVWLSWSDHAVLGLARWIDEERHLEELPYLADALTDAGCTEETLLRHLRDPGPHARGCWGLDLVLARE